MSITLMASAAFASEPPSAFDMMKPSAYGEVELSPSGRYLAFIATHTQKQCLDKFGQVDKEAGAECKEKHRKYRTRHQINIFDIETEDIARSIPVPKNMYVQWLDWASDDHLLSGLIAPTTVATSGGYAIGGSRVFSFPVAGGDPAVLFGDEKGLARSNRYLSRVSNMLRHDPEHVIMPANRNGDFDLWKVNVTTGSAERIALGASGTFHWFTNAAGEAVLRFDCKGKFCRKVNVLAQVSGGEKWEKIKTFKVKPDEDSDEFDFWPLQPAENDGTYYVLSREDDAARRAIKIFDLRTREYVETVFEHPKMDAGGITVDGQTGQYQGAWYYEDRLTYVFKNAEQQQHIDALNDFFDNVENVDLLGYSADKTKMILYVTAPNNPGEYYIYDFTKMKVERIFQRKPDLGERALNKTHILTVPTRDGASITAYHTVPDGVAAGTAPLLVMPHGGPEVRDYYDHDPTAQFFARRGYQILRVNFRGSSGYGRAFAEAGYGEWGGIMQDDVSDAVKYLHDKGAAAPQKTCIVGYSYGGYVALYGAATTPNLYQCVVGGGGVYDIVRDLRRSKSDYGGNSETFEYWEKSIGSLKDDKDKLEALSPVNMADKIKAPVLLIHAKGDAIVYDEQMSFMHDAFKKAGKEVEILELSGEGHRNWSLESHILYLETIEAFLDEHLK